MVTLEELADRKKIAPAVLARCGVLQREQGLEFEYRDASGAPARSRMRTALRGADGSSWPPHDERPVREYANTLALLPPASEAWVVEGESDCWILYSHGMAGIGVPGADCIDCLDGSRLARFERLYLVVENVDEGNCPTFPEGASGFVQRVARRLKATGYPGRLLACRPPAGCQDISDVHTRASDFSRTLSEMKSHATPL